MNIANIAAKLKGAFGFVTAQQSVTGGVEIFGPSGDPLIVIADSAPDDDDGRADGVIYIQTEA